MTREDIIRMAREAGWPGIYAKPLFTITMQEDDFLRFAALVAAAEREQCAQTCESFRNRMDAGIEHIAVAIRARGQQ